MRLRKSGRLLDFALDEQGVHAREWSGFRGKADIGVVSNALRWVEAADALIRVHKAGTQSQNLRSKTYDDGYVIGIIKRRGAAIEDRQIPILAKRAAK